MKRYVHNFLLNGLVLGIFLTGLYGTASAQTHVACGRGIAEPPFLSFGADSNLLMLIDNSGSMLDMSYDDPATYTTTAGTYRNQCYDKTFDATKTYAGNFDSDKVYEWYQEIPEWAPGQTVTNGNYYYDSGIVYKAECIVEITSGSGTCLSEDVASLKTNNGTVALEHDDNNIVWHPLLITPDWKGSIDYNANATKFVRYKRQLYYKSGSPTVAAKPDTDSAWEPVKHTWRTDTGYAGDVVVSYKGMLFELNPAAGSLPLANRSSITLWDDIDGSGTPQWQRIDEGYFTLSAAADVTSLCSSGAGTRYTDGSDVCVRIDHSGTTAAGEIDDDKIIAFAATGDLLNWATASKFDIQKNILTGGKYITAYESDATDNRLVSETRGCSGHGFVKEVDLIGGTVLTMSTRGSVIDEYENTIDDWIDTTDDTTRLQILGVSASGLATNIEACMQAIVKVSAGQGGQNDIDNCLAPASNNTGTQQAALSGSVNACRQLMSVSNPQPSDVSNGTVTSLSGTCESIYAGGFFPWDLRPENGAYICYGLYDASEPNPRDRTGYMGRCWNASQNSGGSTCLPKPATSDCVATAAGCTYGSGDNNLFKNQITGSKAYNYVCTKTRNNNPTICNNDNSWKQVFILTDDTDGHTISTHTDDPTCGGGGGGGGSATWSGEADCIAWGIIDYCGDLSVPEVIDPTDEVMNTGNNLNLPAMLIDSGVAAQLGTDRPLAVMKGYLKNSIAPTGILQDNAEALRIGAMAFNSLGAYTECQAGTSSPIIEKYCPNTTNKDGAQVISPIQLGSFVTDDLGDADASNDILHVNELAAEINDVRATSWTPLAEAVYNAIGYYTQNSEMRINEGDFQTDVDVMAGWQNNKYYAPGSYIMDVANGTNLYKTVAGGTSSGAGVASDTGVIWEVIPDLDSANPTWTNDTTYPAGSIIKHDGKLFRTLLGGKSVLKDEAATLGKSGPFYDASVIWEFLIDPVVNYCQGNYLLIISEGASTADISSDVEAFVLGTSSNIDLNQTAIDDGEGAADAAVAGQCSDGLLGSSYVDDLTYFALDANNQFTVYPDGNGTLADNSTLPDANAPFDPMPKNNITTYIVTAGAPRDDGTADECNPKFLMDQAAANGGSTSAIAGENPAQLEQELLAVFNELRQRSSAGSAASVISSARGGEGAIYQAIFWPELVRTDSSSVEKTVKWVGDVHGLFLDASGYMYEDTDGNRTLNPSEDLDNDGKLDLGEDLNGDGIFDVATEDKDGDLTYDRTEDLNGDGTFDVGEDIYRDGVFDIDLEDLNGNGIFDTVENVSGSLDCSGPDDMDFDNDGNCDTVFEDIDGDFVFDNTYEDTDGDLNIGGVDKRVIIYFDKTPGVEKSRACWNTSILSSLGESCTDSGDMDEIHFLWSANQWLSEYPDLTNDPLSVPINRASASSTVGYNEDSRERYIFTWNDVDKDGIVDGTVPGDGGEVVHFTQQAFGGPDWSTVASDFDSTTGAQVEQIIDWMRGDDNAGAGFRTRQTVLIDPDNTATRYPITWRLGDIIHSTPMTVAAPAEGYHLIYNDFSFAEFLERWKNRRHMVYFGANDGMLHAVNAGFYEASSNKFWLGYKTPTEYQFDITTDPTNDTYFKDTGPALGTEMWAYVPYNLHPHLRSLTEADYAHKYFVDQRSRIFDVQIFEEEGACATDKTDPDCIHPNGWGTILVGGMRLGGAPVRADELANWDGTDDTKFASSYFILDITNPEAPPVLLGELTQTTDPGDNIVDLGYSTVISTMIIIKDSTTNQWYLVLGSGPHGPKAMKGQSDQGAKVSILPLDWTVDTTVAPGKTALRIPDIEPTATNPGGTFEPTDAMFQSFVSDLITVDFDINPSYEQYKSDAVYFGTVEGETDENDFTKKGFSTYPDGATYWNGGGHMYRLVMQPSGHTVGLKAGDPVTVPNDWGLTTLLNLGSQGGFPNPITSQEPNTPIQPITAAASIGTDGYNFWLYFGTGRFFDSDDKTDRQQQTYYGIKEPMELVDDVVNSVTYRRRLLNWEEVELEGTAINDPGGKGLAKVDEILVELNGSKRFSSLTCRDIDDIPDGGPIGNLNCLLSYTNGGNIGSINLYDNANDPYFDKLERYIAGQGRCVRNNCTEIPTCNPTLSPAPADPYNDPDYKSNCVDGWYKDFWPYENREKNVGQATLLGGLVTFTTYQPNSGLCQAEGTAYLYGVYYKTGTAWIENIFGEYGIDSNQNVKDKLSLGRGLATTPNLHVGSGGKDGEGPKAFVQTSTGEIKEIKQENLPIKNYGTGRSKWQEYERP